MSDDKLTPLAKLREPFPENQISQLPKPLKKRDEMDKLPKATCKVCGGYHATSSMIHLSYVGHAALTDRLLDTDPEWTWEPMAVDSTGYPVIDKDGGMWIKLTVCGVTRYGYGDAQGKSGGDAMKERIGDALRNAAMRFGAALDLWHKGELHVDEETTKPPAKAPNRPQETPKPSPPTTATDTPAQKLLTELAEFCGGVEDMMEVALKDHSEFEGTSGKVHLTLERLKSPVTAAKQAGFDKWCNKTRDSIKKSKESARAEMCAECRQPIVNNTCACAPFA